jgi:hypothetical protein
MCLDNNKTIEITKGSCNKVAIWHEKSDNIISVTP